MPLTTKLDRKLRPAEDSTDDEEYYEVSERSSPSIIDTGEGADILSSDDEDASSIGTSLENDAVGAKAQMSKVSFGALSRAQETLLKEQQGSRKRKRSEERSKSQDDKLQALRQRLQEIKAAKEAQLGPSGKKIKSSMAPHGASRLMGDDDDSDEEDDDVDVQTAADTIPHARSNKHAPAMRSSKRPVSRKRRILETKKPTFRDPRFDAVTGPRPDQNAIDKRYAFLDDYRNSEMRELREVIKKTKDENDKERLKKKLTSMESQQKARDNKQKQQEVIRDHRKKEKELVKQGKQPFYLKKSEQKKQALINRFEGMKAKDRDRAIERRRKKSSAKELKNMPADRRAI